MLDAIRAVVGERGLLTDPADTAACTEDWCRLYRDRSALAKPSAIWEMSGKSAENGRS